MADLLDHMDAAYRRQRDGRRRALIRLRDERETRRNDLRLVLGIASDLNQVIRATAERAAEDGAEAAIELLIDAMCTLDMHPPALGTAT